MVSIHTLWKKTTTNCCKLGSTIADYQQGSLETHTLWVDIIMEMQVSFYERDVFFLLS